MTIKAVIFDVDGVVFKTHDDNGNYLWSKFIERDLGINSKHLQKIFSLEWYKLLKGHLDTSEYLQQIFKDSLFRDVDITPQKYISYWLEHDNHVNQNVLDFIELLKVPCYLATNQEKYRSKHIIENIGSYFHGCFASHKINYIKPEAQFFSYIESYLGLSPRDLILIDDTLENVEGARARGWNTYLYKDDLDNLKNYLQGLWM